MIPTVLVFALVGGLLLPHRVVWVVAVLTVFWVVLLVSGGEPVDAGLVVGGAALGFVNAAVGAAAGWALRRLRPN